MSSKTPEPINPSLRPLTWPPIRVDVRVSPADLEAMVARVEQNFRHLGETEPHWSVLTADEFRADNIAANEDIFLASGKEPVQEFEAALARCGLILNGYRRCLELGCGTGRTTIWLAERVHQLIAADISAPHLQLAAQTVARFGRRNVSFFQVGLITSIPETGDFDVFFSLITLQHNPPPVIRLLLRTALRALRPGGIAYFQVPTYRLGYTFDAAQYLASEPKIGVPEMHVLPQPELLRLVEITGCRLLEMREDGAAGGNHVSNRLLVQKPESLASPSENKDD